MSTLAVLLMHLCIAILGASGTLYLLARAMDDRQLALIVIVLTVVGLWIGVMSVVAEASEKFHAKRN